VEGVKRGGEDMKGEMENEGGRKGASGLQGWFLPLAGVSLTLSAAIALMSHSLYAASHCGLADKFADHLADRPRPTRAR